jgi:type I restriction enzyme R subunit
MVTNTKESGFESLIVDWLVNHNDYERGANDDYDKDHAVDAARLFRFLSETQPDELAKTGALSSDLKRRQFLDRLQGEIAKRGVTDVLRKGIKVYPADLIMFYMLPSEKNDKAKKMFDKNIFSVTRQLLYSKDNTRLALDLAVFINGLPVFTIELKNQLTKQDVDDAVHQYKKYRDPRELLFQFKRCIAHFAIDDNRIKFCTKLNGKASWFLPFDKGYKDGAGNPPNPDGIRTDYFWKQILLKNELANIIENYAQVTEEEDPETKKKKFAQIFPRYHQLSAVKKLLADVKDNGVGQKYLIQHSAGSGKSNSIAWLANQLIGLERDGKPIVDSVIVVTDRINLDKQIRNTIKQFTQVSSTVEWADSSEKLRTAIVGGKRIIISTVHKFSFILDSIGTDHKGRTFGIIIDEAHSSQSGNMSSKMNTVLSGEYVADDEETTEDKIIKLMEGRKLLTNASYFAFTATPKNKTLEMFGTPVTEGEAVKHIPFHTYKMKQAIQEGFILDVLKYYTPYSSYYKIVKATEDDPQFDKKKAEKKLRAYVESQEITIARKAEIMVTHFHEQVIAKAKIGGKARAMVVASGINRAIDYYLAIDRCLEERKSPYKAIIAFSGEKERGGKTVTEASFNGFPSNKIEKEFKKEPYRILVVADKFQTGYDEPLLHTMYVDKVLTDIKAVQTLSRLNRAYPQKNDTFVLDFANDAETIQEAFGQYYKTTILSSETDPNKLYDLIQAIEKHQVYTEAQIDVVVDRYLSGAERETIDPILDACVEEYKLLSEDDQVEFKSSAKSFIRTYGFLGSILPYGNLDWEKLYIFLNMLVHKLPSPPEDDLAAGILDAIDLDSYRLEANATVAIALADEDAKLDPLPVSTATGKPEPEMDTLTAIINEFNDLFGNISWQDTDNVRRQIQAIPAMVAKDKKYKNAMRNSDKQNARMESDYALQKVLFSIMSDNMELFKQFTDNPDFKKWLSDMVFSTTYKKEDSEYSLGDGEAELLMVAEEESNEYNV